jgi:hypothetical protein
MTQMIDHEAMSNAAYLVLPVRASPADRLRGFVTHWKQGRLFRIPVCCRVHFCIDQALGRTAAMVRWRQIGIWSSPAPKRRFVPCGVFHGGYSPYSPALRVVRIVVFNTTLLLPGARANWMRQRTREPGPVWCALEVEQRAALSRIGWNGPMWWARSSPPPPAARSRIRA